MRSILKFSIVYFLTLIFPAITFGADRYQLSWFTIEGGGGTSSGGVYVLTGTIGQPDSWTSSSDDYELSGGFQPCNLLYQNYTEAPYDQWYIVGKPACWKNPRQLLGDADGQYQSKDRFWVSTNDLEILIDAWNKPLDQLTGNQICADFDHLPQGRQRYRVSTNDLDILIANWQIPGGPSPKNQ